jgi:hypothetical protein
MIATAKPSWHDPGPLMDQGTSFNLEGMKERMKEAIMYCKRFVTIITLALAGVVLMAAAAQATAYTWTGTTDNTWATSTNWTGGTFPGNGTTYTDQATINYLAARPTVSLSTTELLGGATTALTIGAKATTPAVNALTIGSGGLLGMQGGISIGTRRTLTIASGGTLRNDATSSATTYTIAGSPILTGGTISSLNGGIWSVSGISGYGTISAPITTGGIISNNVANQTLHITGNVSTGAQRGLGGTSTLASGALLSIEGGNITGTGSGSGITNYNLVNLNGHFNNITLYNDGSYNGATPGDWNYYNLTGDSSWNNGALNIMKFNGHKLDVTGSVTNFASSGNGVVVGTGTLNNPGTAVTTISNGNFINLAGGYITGASGSEGFKFATNLKGYGTISTPVEILANGGLQVTGGTLMIDSTTLKNTGGAGISNASDGTVYVHNSTVNWGNFTNNGAYKSDPSTQTFSTLTVGSGGSIKAAAGDTYIVNGDFNNNSTQNNSSWDTTAAILQFKDGTTHTFKLAGVDGGQNISGYTDNFAWGTLDLTDFGTSEKLTLADGNTGNASTALYVHLFKDNSVSGGSVGDIISAFNIYYDATLADNEYLHALTYSFGSGGGFLAPIPAAAVPVPPSLLLLGSGLMGMGLLGYRQRKTNLS